MKPKLSAFRFALLQPLYWCFAGSIGTFATAMFLSEGYSAAFIGMAALFYTGGGFLGQLAMGYVADRLRTNRGVFVGASLLTLPVAFGLCFLPWTWTRILCLALVGFFQTPINAILDTWILTGLPNAEKRYGFIRACGSFGFAVFIALYGLVVAEYGYYIMPWVTVGVCAVMLLAAFSVPDAVAPAAEKAAGKRRLSEDVKVLFKAKHLVCLYLSLLFVGLGFGGLHNILPALLENVGGDVSKQGITMMLGALLEIVVLVSDFKFLRKQPVFLILGSILVAFPVLIGVGLANTTWTIVVCTSGRGLCYAMALLGLRKVLLSLAPQGLEATAQSIADGFCNCLGPMFGALLCGVLLNEWGSMVMALACIGFVILAFIFLVPVLKNLLKKQPA